VRQEIVSRHKDDINGNPAGGETAAVGLFISWQDGPLGTGSKRKPPNGCFVETVIAAAIDRLEYYQRSRFQCTENGKAIRSLQEALDILEQRTKRREVLGIEGTHEGN